MNKIPSKKSNSIQKLSTNTMSDIMLLNYGNNLLTPSEVVDTVLSTNTTVSNTQDGNAVVLRYGNLTINSGVTLTPQYRCKGMIIIVNGDCVVNGTISMTARGPVGAGSVTDYDMFRLGGSKNVEFSQPNMDDLIDYIKKSLNSDINSIRSYSDLPERFQPKITNKINPQFSQIDSNYFNRITLPSVGGQGGLSAYGGYPGYPGTNRGCGGGGSGYGCGRWIGVPTQGGIATTWSGGSGSGAITNGDHSADPVYATSNIGGPGGKGIATGSPHYTGGGGAGNPGGLGGDAEAGHDGTGGVIILIVKGHLTVGPTGVISADGSAGGAGSCGGGGSGGGSINIVYGKTFTNNGSVHSTGGPGGLGSGVPNYDGGPVYPAPGGKGGDGCVTIEKDFSTNYINNEIPYLSNISSVPLQGELLDVVLSSNYNIPSTLDGDMVVYRTGNLTINSEVTLTPSNRCKGLMIIVNGNLLLNGIISMTARGCIGTGVDTYHNINVNTPSLSVMKKVMLFPAVGGSGGPAGYGLSAGINGLPGTNRRCGGGGSGGSSQTYAGLGYGRRGGNATTWSGGSGGGSMYEYSGTNTDPVQGSDIGGIGGSAMDVNPMNGGGGAGNPGGSPRYDGSSGNNGTGGVLILVVKGNLVVSSSGSISANGSNGGNSNDGPLGGFGGGGSGGGSINIIYGENYSNSGSITANGGFGGTATHAGGKGGNGCITIEHQIW